MNKDTDIIVKVLGIIALVAISLFVTIKIYHSLPSAVRCRVQNPFNSFQAELCIASEDIMENLGIDLN